MPAGSKWPTTTGSVFFDNVASAPTLRRANRAGSIKKLATNLWSADLVTSDDALIRHNINSIVAEWFPGATIVDRTAAEDGAVSANGLFTIAHGQKSRSVAIGTITVLVRPADPHPSDYPWSHGLMMATRARALVENIAPYRSVGRPPKSLLTASELEEWLATKRMGMTSERFEQLRLDAIDYACDVSVTDRVERIDALFDQLAGARSVPASAAPLFAAAASGNAWDSRRVALIHRAAEQLSTMSLPDFAMAPSGGTGLAFYESYFSNYIEGTEFTLEEARQIVETQQLPETRHADGHDILGTFLCAAGPSANQTSADPEHLMALMKERHAVVMRGRPEKLPGKWKIANNQAGATRFVDWDKVHGTLLRALEPIGDLTPGFARALFVMFVVAEVHPFADGNGRTARLMMNAELSATDRHRIIVPTIERDSYLRSLKRASNNDGDIGGLVRVLTNSWEWSCSIPWHDRAASEAKVRATNALVSSDEAADRHLHLLIT